ncbi:hypothetical protein V7152_20915 [Neobacillus drentensis]|uniref:hypothetical protein n=1 Tax=Neobacillus drentensis TaxID=220684 RepID=UPI003000C3CE
MNKITKGALAMVLAGAVTFSVANALLAEQPLKRLTKEIAFPISADRKKADVVNQAEKKVKVQTPTTNVKDHDIAAIQVSLKNSNMAKAAIQTDREKTSDRNTTTTPVATTKPEKSTKAPTTTKPVTSSKAPTTTKPVTSSKAPTTTKPATSPKPPTTTTVTKPTGSNTNSATKTTTNRGQQVSQEAKEKAAIQRDIKENNGKKM